MNIVSESRTQMSFVFTGRKIHTALRKNFPQCTYHTSFMRYNLLFYFEKICKLIGTLTVIFVKKKRMIKVSSLDGMHKCLFKSFQLEPYFYEMRFQNWNDVMECIMSGKSLTALRKPN